MLKKFLNLEKCAKKSKPHDLKIQKTRLNSTPIEPSNCFEVLKGVPEVLLKKGRISPMLLTTCKWLVRR
jgi:hypothetical protein